jgi:hypothetical protein
MLAHPLVVKNGFISKPFIGLNKMDYPPSAYTLDGMEEIVREPIVIRLRFYWNNDESSANVTTMELAEFMTTYVYAEFYDVYMPRYAKCLREVFDQAIYIDSQQINPFNSGSIEDIFEYEFETNTLKITFVPDRIPVGWDRDEIAWCFSEFGVMLSHTLWDSSPGTNLVHESGAVVDFEIL